MTDNLEMTDTHKKQKGVIINKSKRTQEVDRDVQLELDNVELQIFKPGEPKYGGYLENLFFLAQFICILCYGLFTEYGDGVAPNSVSVDDASGFNK